jgi:50S ribosomal protein L16 3-hydroxylase
VGESYIVGLEGVRNLTLLCEKNSLSITDWQSLRDDDASANILCQLIAEGGWFWQ